jgi:8-oxo-dGTP pyrophosphatase MutT (NUDIX family)
MSSANRARTVLEQRIRERRLTLDECVAQVEMFAREHGEPGTLSSRHLQRLISGRVSSHKLMPATARLLERVFLQPIDELLSPPSDTATSAHVLRVAIALVVKDHEVLLVCRRGDSPNQSAWQFPAGMVKPGGSARAVAVQETLAETGVHCVAVADLGSRVHPATNVLCEYVRCDYIGGTAENLDVAENVGVLWVSRQAVTRLIPASDIYPPVMDDLTSTSPCA